MRSLAVVVVGLALAALGAGAGSFLVADQQRPAYRELVRREGLRRRPPAEAQDLPEVVLRIASIVEVALRVVVAAAVLAAIGYALHRLVRGLLQLRRLRAERSRGLVRPAAWDPGESTADDAEEALRKRVSRELGLLAADLDAAPDPREVVIACYARMEALAAAAGTPKRPPETPAELVGRLLAEQQVPEPAVRRLTALFEEARFSRHPIDEGMRTAARASLADVRALLGTPA